MFPGFKTGFTAFAVLFLPLRRLFCVDRMYRCKDTCENMFTGFETDFTAFAVLFLAIWTYFCVDRRYRCQDSSENVCAPAFKSVLRYSPFSFQHFGGYFASIGDTGDTIRAKTCVPRL